MKMVVKSNELSDVVGCCDEVIGVKPVSEVNMFKSKYTFLSKAYSDNLTFEERGDIIDYYNSHYNNSHLIYLVDNYIVHYNIL